MLRIRNPQMSPQREDNGNLTGAAGHSRVQRRWCLLVILAAGMLFLQGCIYAPYSSYVSGLDSPRVERTTGGRIVLSWNPQTNGISSRLAKSGDTTAREPVQNLRYDVEIYQEFSDAEHDKMNFMDQSKLKYEGRFQRIHFRRGIKETRYELPFALEEDTEYLWRVRPVYDVNGQPVAEDWTRDNTAVFFMVLLPNSGGDTEYIKTAPLKLVPGE
ncbi:MAG: hypothetical protein OEZ59_12920 [Deltaproteobacteria bacterium]|nr:hypothetical protein [Deltaproteobacteria bacterium]